MKRKNDLNNYELQTVVNSSKYPDFVSFKSALTAFLKDCEIRNLRPYTITFYKREIGYFYKVIREQQLDPSPSSVTKDMIKDNFILYMKEKGMKTTTINDRLRAIRSFFNFLEREKLIVKNPYTGIKLLRMRQTIIQSFDTNQINLLFKQPDITTFTGVRDYTFMMLLLDTGIRLSELYAVDVTDLLWTEKRLHIRNAKGFKERLVPLSDRMLDQLRLYLRIRGEVDNENALFVTLIGHRLARVEYQHILTKYGNMAGITDKVRVSPHTFRHTFARLSVMNGAGIFDLQSIMGHSNLEMAKTYVHLFSDDLRQHHEEFSPLKALKKRV